MSAALNGLVKGALLSLVLFGSERTNEIWQQSDELSSDPKTLIYLVPSEDEVYENLDRADNRKRRMADAAPATTREAHSLRHPFVKIRPCFRFTP